MPGMYGVYGVPDAPGMPGCKENCYKDPTGIRCVMIGFGPGTTFCQNNLLTGFRLYSMCVWYGVEHTMMCNSFSFL